MTILNLRINISEFYFILSCCCELSDYVSVYDQYILCIDLTSFSASREIKGCRVADSRILRIRILWDTYLLYFLFYQHPSLKLFLSFNEAPTPTSILTSLTVLKTGSPRCSVPPLPALTPPTMLVPYSMACFEWKVPCFPVKPWQMTRVSLLSFMLTLVALYEDMDREARAAWD